VAWYAPEFPEEPALFKDITPAWNNANLLSLARVTRSSCILAHVRAATSGLPVIQLNCHPFVHGPFTFMHNGTVGGFNKIRRALVNRLSDRAYHSIAGSTDSEHIFALFIDHHSRLQKGCEPGIALSDALTATIGEIEELREEAGITEPALLNLAVSDGHAAAVSRYITKGFANANSLYVHAGGSCICSGGRLRLTSPEDQIRAVIIASEPLTEENTWTSVETGTVLVVDPDLDVHIVPISRTG
jgi:predicted glutamine amidotransferase